MFTLEPNYRFSISLPNLRGIQNKVSVIKSTSIFFASNA